MVSLKTHHKRTNSSASCQRNQVRSPGRLLRHQRIARSTQLATSFLLLMWWSRAGLSSLRILCPLVYSMSRQLTNARLI